MKTKPKTKTNQAADQHAKSAPPPPQMDGVGVTWVLLKQLKFHPLLDQVAMLDDVISYMEGNRKADPEALQEKLDFREAFKQSLKEEGIKTPILAVKHGEEWLVVNGRHRMTYGLAAGLEYAPVIEVTSEHANATILRENALTWARTKGAIAWLAVCLNPEVVDIRPGRPANSHSVGINRTPGGDVHSHSVGINRTRLAAMVGVSTPLVDQACEIHAKVGKSEVVRARVESMIASGVGLGGVIAYLGSDEHAPRDEDGKLRRPPSSVPGLCRTLTTVSTQLKEWPRWNEDQKELAVTKAAELFSGENGEEFLSRVMDAMENL